VPAAYEAGINEILLNLEYPDIQFFAYFHAAAVSRGGQSLLLPGDSGAGKTSLFLCPIIEQLVMQGDCSVIVLDLKADTLELLGTLQAAAEAVRRERGVRMPLKTFSNQAAMPTFAFNPMTQPFWAKFDYGPQRFRLNVIKHFGEPLELREVAAGADRP
jgi:hypothetical protein